MTNIPSHKKSFIRPNLLRVFLYGVLAVLFFACSDNSSKNASAPAGADSPRPDGSYSLEITPRQATRNSTLTLITQGFALSEATVAWLADGYRVSSSQLQQLRISEFDQIKKGASIQAKAVVGGREIASNSITVLNSPPELARVKLLPEVFKPGDRFYVEVAGNDVDGDAVAFSYAWTKNGSPSGAGSRLESDVKRGDVITVQVTPSDGESYGNGVVLEREIRNMAPIIAEHKEFSFDGTTYTYQLKASDPDGDRLTYSLESPPAGMTIDSSTGLIKWIVPQEFKGNKQITAAVADGNGGIAKYTIVITIQ